MCDYTYNYAYLYVNVYVYDYVLIIKREVFILNIKRTFAAVSAAVMLCTSGNGAAALEMQDLFEGYSAEQSEAAQTLNKMAASTIMPVCTDNTEGKLRPISFIRMVSDGYMRIVADTEAKKVTIEYYTADFTLKSSKEIALILNSPITSSAVFAKLTESAYSFQSFKSSRTEFKACFIKITLSQSFKIFPAIPPVILPISSHRRVKLKTSTK